MKNKLLGLWGALSLLLLLVLSGCSLAEAAQGGEASGPHQLCGVYVTTEHVDTFDATGYFEDHPDQITNGGDIFIQDSAAYTGKLFFTKVPGQNGGEDRYVLDGPSGLLLLAVPVTETDGIPHYETYADPGVEGSFHTEIREDQGETRVEHMLEGTVTFPVSRDTFLCCFNPVYRGADGVFYLTGGSGISSQSEVESAFTHSENESYRVTEGAKAHTVSFDVKMIVQGQYPPKAYTVLYMSGDDKVISQESYTPETLPPQISPPQGTAYLLLETQRAVPPDTDPFKRQIVGSGDALTLLRPGELGFYLPREVPVSWPQKEAVP